MAEMPLQAGKPGPSKVLYGPTADRETQQGECEESRDLDLKLEKVTDETVNEGTEA
jgi:hypothetical protein